MKSKATILLPILLLLSSCHANSPDKDARKFTPEIEEIRTRFFAHGTSGCGTDVSISPGSHSSLYNITVSSQNREYLFYLPKNYDKNTPAPVILNYHGHSESPYEQERITQMSNSQVNPDYIIVYPAGLPGTDGKTAWEGAPYSSKANDVEFTANLLDHIQNHFCVDTGRIFATGKSNGGGFVNYMACDASISGRFAAYFPVAGAYYEMGQNCSPAYKPTRIHAIHGTNDSVIAFRGGEHRGAMLPYVPDWIRAWGRRNGCHHETKTLKNRTVTKFNEGCDTVLYAVHGAGHWWMSTIGYKRSKGVLQGEPTSINATNFVLDFFGSTPSLS